MAFGLGATQYAPLTPEEEQALIDAGAAAPATAPQSGTAAPYTPAPPTEQPGYGEGALVPAGTPPPPTQTVSYPTATETSLQAGTGDPQYLESADPTYGTQVPVAAEPAPTLGNAQTTQYVAEAPPPLAQGIPNYREPGPPPESYANQSVAGTLGTAPMAPRGAPPESLANQSLAGTISGNPYSTTQPAARLGGAGTTMPRTVDQGLLSPRPQRGRYMGEMGERIPSDEITDFGSGTQVLPAAYIPTGLERTVDRLRTEGINGAVGDDPYTEAINAGSERIISAMPSAIQDYFTLDPGLPAYALGLGDMSMINTGSPRGRPSINGSTRARLSGPAGGMDAADARRAAEAAPPNGKPPAPPPVTKPTIVKSSLGEVSGSPAGSTTPATYTPVAPSGVAATGGPPGVVQPRKPPPAPPSGDIPPPPPPTLREQQTAARAAAAAKGRESIKKDKSLIATDAASTAVFKEAAARGMPLDKSGNPWNASPIADPATRYGPEVPRDLTGLDPDIRMDITKGYLPSNWTPPENVAPPPSAKQQYRGLGGEYFTKPLPTAVKLGLAAAAAGAATAGGARQAGFDWKQGLGDALTGVVESGSLPPAGVRLPPTPQGGLTTDPSLVDLRPPREQARPPKDIVEFSEQNAVQGGADTLTPIAREDAPSTTPIPQGSDGRSGWVQKGPPTLDGAGAVKDAAASRFEDFLTGWDGIPANVAGPVSDAWGMLQGAAGRLAGGEVGSGSVTPGARPTQEPGMYSLRGAARDRDRELSTMDTTTLSTRVAQDKSGILADETGPTTVYFTEGGTPIGYDNAAGQPVLVGSETSLQDFWGQVNAEIAKKGTSGEAATPTTPAQGSASPAQGSNQTQAATPSNTNVAQNTSTSNTSSQRSSGSSGGGGTYSSGGSGGGGGYTPRRRESSSMEDMFGGDDADGLNIDDFMRDYDGDGTINASDRAEGKKRFNAAKMKRRKGRKSKTGSTVPARTDSAMRTKILGTLDASMSKSKKR